MTDRPARAGSDRPETDTASSAPTVDDGPLTLRLAVLLLWAQAFFAAVLAVVEVVELIAHGTADLDWAAWIIAGPMVAAAGLFTAGRLLVNRRISGRGLAVALQLCAVVVVFFMVTGDNDLWVRIVGVVIGVSVVTCIGLVTAPPSQRALFGG